METLMLNETEVQNFGPWHAPGRAGRGIRGRQAKASLMPQNVMGHRAEHGVSALHASLSTWPRNHRQARLRLHDDERVGRSFTPAIICLFDAQTGTPLWFMDGTLSITALRTAGAARLSRLDLWHVLIPVCWRLSAPGCQGRAHLKMLPRVRQFQSGIALGTLVTHPEQLAATDRRARAVETIEQAVRGADVVCLCTHSGQPVISLPTGSLLGCISLLLDIIHQVENWTLK